MLYPLFGIVIIALVQIPPLFGSAAGIKSGSGLQISADPFETKLFLLKLISLVLVGELLVQQISSKRHLQILICVVVGVGVASALFGLGRHFIQHSVYLSSPTTESSFGQFNNRNHFAFLMEMTFGLILGLMLGGGWWRGKFLIAPCGGYACLHRADTNQLARRHSEHDCPGGFFLPCQPQSYASGNTYRKSQSITGSTAAHLQSSCAACSTYDLSVDHFSDRGSTGGW